LSLLGSGPSGFAWASLASSFRYVMALLSFGIGNVAQMNADVLNCSIPLVYSVVPEKQQAPSSGSEINRFLDGRDLVRIPARLLAAPMGILHYYQVCVRISQITTQKRHDCFLLNPYLRNVHSSLVTAIQCNRDSVLV
jgi:hypothetical protein